MTKHLLVLIIIACFLLPLSGLASEGRITENRMTTISAGVALLNGPTANLLQKKLVTEAAEYILQAGDEIEISVWGHPDYKKNLQIDPDGNIMYLLIGECKAGGLTIGQLKTELTKKISKYLNSPVVDVIPVSFKSRRFTILGSVNRPGVYELDGNASIIQGIAMAGGLRAGSYKTAVELADLSHAMLFRKGEYVNVDFDALIRAGDMSHNLLLTNGDYIYIPNSVDQEITVLGEVIRTGGYPFSEGTSLLKLIVQTGGFKEQANKGSVVIIRDSLSHPTIYRIDVMVLINGQNKDFRLAPGDIVYVPKYSPLPFVDIVQLALETFTRKTASSIGRKVANKVVK